MQPGPLCRYITLQAFRRLKLTGGALGSLCCSLPAPSCAAPLAVRPAVQLCLSYARAAAAPGAATIAALPQPPHPSCNSPRPAVPASALLQARCCSTST